MSETIHHEQTYENATPDRIFRILTDPEQFSAMSGGAPAEIDAREGGAFSCFGGMIHGRNIECAPGARLVQAWRAKNWPPGVYSIARFELVAKDDGTRVVLDHTGFPEGQGEHLAQGWQANYLEPLAKLLSSTTTLDSAR